MNNVIVLILLLIWNVSVGQNIEVTSKSDPRYVSYIDSLKYYHFGQYQLYVAKGIKNNLILSEGQIAFNKIINKMKELDISDTKILPILVDSNYHIYFMVTTNGSEITHWNWIPNIYQKPKITVICKEIDSTEQVIHKKEYDFIWMPSGEKLKKEKFIKIYRDSVWDTYVGKNDKK